MTSLPAFELGALAGALFAVDLDQLTEISSCCRASRASAAGLRGSDFEDWQGDGAEGWDRWGWQSRRSGFARLARPPCGRSMLGRATTGFRALTLVPPSLGLHGGSRSFSRGMRSPWRGLGSPVQNILRRDDSPGKASERRFYRTGVLRRQPRAWQRLCYRRIPPGFIAVQSSDQGRAWHEQMRPGARRRYRRRSGRPRRCGLGRRRRPVRE